MAAAASNVLEERRLHEALEQRVLLDHGPQSAEHLAQMVQRVLPHQSVRSGEEQPDRLLSLSGLHLPDDATKSVLA